MYYCLLLYLHYRPRDLSQGFNTAVLIKFRLFIKSLEISTKEHYFHESDPIKVFQFLIYFYTEADKLNMLEWKEYLALALPT